MPDILLSPAKGNISRAVWCISMVEGERDQEGEEDADETLVDVSIWQTLGRIRLRLARHLGP